MQSGNKLIKISIISGAIVLVLVIVLLSLLLGKQEEVVIERIAPPETEFSYDPEGDYGAPLIVSPKLEDELSDFSVSGCYEIMNRIIAFFKTYYPEHGSLALVKNSYIKTGDEGKEKYSLGLVTDLGAVVWLEVDGTDYNAKESKIRLYNIDKELVYQDVIEWDEIEEMDSNESKEGDV